MRKATKSDKRLVVNILARSFDKNPSVNYIIKQSGNREQHIRSLMQYAFDLCYLFGDVFITEDHKACALVQYPDKKRTTLQTLLLDAGLVVGCIGVGNIRKTLAREALLKKIRGTQMISNLWFIGVDPHEQHSGIGSRLLKSVISYSMDRARPVYLETSNPLNLPWYQKFGFNVYAQENLGHTLYFLKREIE